eukprot:gene1893-56466_t
MSLGHQLRETMRRSSSSALGAADRIRCRWCGKKCPPAHEARCSYRPTGSKAGQRQGSVGVRSGSSSCGSEDATPRADAGPPPPQPLETMAQLPHTITSIAASARDSLVPQPPNPLSPVPALDPVPPPRGVVHTVSRLHAACR